MADKKDVAAIYSAARAEIVKRHQAEYRELVASIAAERGVSLRARRTAAEKAAAEAARVAEVAARKAARAAAKEAKAEAKRQEKIAKAKARLAALEDAAA